MVAVSYVFFCFVIFFAVLFFLLNYIPGLFGFVGMLTRLGRGNT